MTFQVGDRVRWKHLGHPFLLSLPNPEGVVEKVNSDNNILIKFDCTETEHRQCFEAGWLPKNFELIDSNETTLEDWS